MKINKRLLYILTITFFIFNVNIALATTQENIAKVRMWSVERSGCRLSLDEDFRETVYSNKPCEQSNGVYEYLSDIREEKGGCTVENKYYDISCQKYLKLKKLNIKK